MMPISTQAQVKKLFIRLIIFCVLMYVLDAVVGAGLKYLYFSNKEGRYYDLTYAIDSTKADVIVVGSSRGKNDYVAQDIEDSLHLTCYNAAYEGAHFLHQYAVIKSILNRHHPKILIWDYWQGLEEDPQNYLELSTILPYYNHELIKPIIDLRGPYERYKLVSKIYPYNSTIIYNLNKKIHFYKNTEKDASRKGFTPLFGVWKEKIQVLDKITSPIDSVNTAAYLNVINFCKLNNIKLYIVISPHYGIYKSPPNYDSIAKALAIENNIPFLDFSNDSTFIKSYNPYFSNRIHLNETGAKIFTKEFISKIKKS